MQTLKVHLRTLTETEDREDKQFAFKAPASYADILTAGSIEAVNTANNHSHDYGDQSFNDTLSALDAAGIIHFGYDETAVTEVNGIKVGMVGIYELNDHLGREEQLKQNIEKVKKDGAQLERILAEFLSPRMECIKEYDQRYRQLAAQSEELIDIFINPLKYNLSRRDKKKKERDLNECAGNLKQLDDEILKEKYRLEEDGKASGELMKKLLQVRALVRETKEQAERRLNKNRSISGKRP